MGIINITMFFLFFFFTFSLFTASSNACNKHGDDATCHRGSNTHTGVSHEY